MNRRSFILSGTAGLSFISLRAAAQRGSTATTVVVSELTGAEIDFTESGFTLEEQSFEPEAGSSAKFAWEQFVFNTGEGRLVLDMFTGGTQDFPKYMEEFTVGFDMIFGIEDHGYAELEDGGYSAFSYSEDAVYLEYQLGAFPEVDFMVTFSSTQASFQDEFAKVQSVMVGGAAPCLFTEESKVEDVVFAGATQTTTSTAGSRTTRGSNSSQTSNTSTTNTTTNTGTAGTDSDYIDAIVTHRNDFLDSYDLFMGHLGVVAEETTTDAEKSDLFAQMYDIALIWKTYPNDAQALAIPAGMEDLGVLYGEWAAVIGEMGTLFEELYNGSDTIDAFIAAVSEWELLDAELQVALEGQGFKGHARAAGAIASIRGGLKATWRSVH